jgi:ribosomal protein L11 methyltransferase
MPVLQVAITVGDGDPAPVEAVLTSLGAWSVTLEDAADDPVLEPAPGETPLWPTVRLRALFAADADRAAIEAALSAVLPPAAALRFEQLEDRAWEREWLRDFRATRFGKRLWVCPTGASAGDPCAVEVVLDPGLAFGTGSHRTTALCLEWLDGRELAGRRVIDYGCGSGILAIAALRLGAAGAVAFDIDSQALLATRENAERNGVADRLRILASPPEGQACCDILVANILAGPLTELAGRFAALLRPGGQIALSGLLSDQVTSVVAAYRPWFMIGATAIRDGWALLSGERGHTKKL